MEIERLPKVGVAKLAEMLEVGETFIFSDQVGMRVEADCGTQLKCYYYNYSVPIVWLFDAKIVFLRPDTQVKSVELVAVEQND
jgi:hypothetical protein